ncbi:DUF5686 and carboxypeptidase-like regulatory domain-containing protein [Paludibacter sp.]
MIAFRKIVISIVVLLLAYSTFSQQTQVIGNVRNKIDKSPVQSVNIYFKGTNIGVQSDEDGFYMIKNSGDETILVFSCIGYKSQEHKIKGGEINGLYVEMREDINILQDLFVLPGVNPALDLMNKVRYARISNDINNSDAKLNIEEEQAVFVQKSIKSDLNNVKHNFSLIYDSIKYTPLFVSSEKYVKSKNAVVKMLKNESLELFPSATVLFEKLLGNMSSDYNFYNNSIVIFGKHIISPTASSANAYYKFFLIDSLLNEHGKQYYLRFKSRNTKNLAFNGELWIDSTSNAITKINVELPNRANINFVENLKISSSCKKLDNGLWLPDSTSISMNMSYQLQLESAFSISDVLFHKLIKINTDDTASIVKANFADTPFSKEEIKEKLAEANDLPMMKTAKWIADGIITGYLNAGKIDVGKVYSLARLTDNEGMRFSIPIRTNEHLMKDISLGGYWGYGLKDKQHKYSLNSTLKLTAKTRTVFNAGFTDDYRRVDYDYNDYQLRENPLLSGDEDIANTIFAFRSSNKTNRRKEFYASLSHDWNKDIESYLTYRNNVYFTDKMLPFTKSFVDINHMLHNSISLTTRFSKDERIYEEGFDRIYIPNSNPVLYFTIEGGKVRILANSYNYLKLNLKLRQSLSFDVGEYNYSIDAGWVIGKVPYNLLWLPQGSETLIFKKYSYNLINYIEYAYDRYIAFHNELIFNGVILNQVPLIKNLNLREMLSLKFIYGSLSQQQQNVLDFPQSIRNNKAPYLELGVGVTNIFRIFSLQSVWRLTDLDKSNIRTWSVITGVRLNF